MASSHVAGILARIAVCILASGYVFAFHPATADAQLLKKLKNKAVGVAKGEVVSTAAGKIESDSAASTQAHDSALARVQASGDTVRVRADSIATPARGKSGALSRVITKANQAATVVEQKTGVSKEAMAKAALTASGVGAAAAIAKPGATIDKAKAGVSAGKTVLSQIQKGRGSGAVAGGQLVNPRPADPTALGVYAPGTMGESEMARIQMEVAQLAMRASSGDTEATRQLMRYQAEATYAMLALQASVLRDPGSQEKNALIAIREALDCAKTGRGCRVNAP